jgi:hypothetical protein
MRASSSDIERLPEKGFRDIDQFRRVRRCGLVRGEKHCGSAQFSMPSASNTALNRG